MKFCFSFVQFSISVIHTKLRFSFFIRFRLSIYQNYCFKVTTNWLSFSLVFFVVVKFYFIIYPILWSTQQSIIINKNFSNWLTSMNFLWTIVQQTKKCFIWWKMIYSQFHIYIHIRFSIEYDNNSLHSNTKILTIWKLIKISHFPLFWLIVIYIFFFRGIFIWKSSHLLRNSIERFCCNGSNQN